MVRGRSWWRYSLIAAAMGAMVCLVAGLADAIWLVTFGVQVNAYVVKIKKEGNNGSIVTSQDISGAFKTALIRQFPSYKTFTLEKTHTAFLAYRDRRTDKEKKDNPNADPRRTSFDVVPGKTLTIQFLGYKGKLINFQLQVGNAFSLPDIDSETYYFMKVSDDEEPTILILYPKLVQVGK